MASASMAASLVGLFILMLFLLLLLFVLACRPWRFLCRRRTFASSTFKLHFCSVPLDDDSRPLFAENLIDAPEQNHDLTRNSVEESSIEVDGSIYSPRTLAVVGDVNFPRKHGLLNKKRISTNVKISAVGDSLVLDVPCDTSQDIQVVQTLNWAPISSSPCEGVNHVRGKDGSCDVEVISDKGQTQISAIRDVAFFKYYHSSTDTGRVSPSDLILKDSEVSGRHAFIDWNTHGWKNVQIRLGIKHESSFGVGIASDPMAMRRGGKKLPMEDMCYCKWPLPGVEQFGLFSIFDGHGGAGAARTASRLLPQIIVDILSNPGKKERVFSCCDATDVLKEAFALTEAALNHQVVLPQFFWCGLCAMKFFAQCANVGDSACILNVNGKDFMMTEDHRVSSILERARLNQSGKPLEEGETRLCGLNLGRMLGDKFLKEQEKRFIADPYVSQVVHIPKGSTAFGILASDGLWDVISAKRAVLLVLQAKGICDAGDANPAEKIANYVLSEARTLRTKDNTSVVFVDFDLMRTDHLTPDLMLYPKKG
ncbi:hypothetical protein HPP92_016876 [Vanilla planifolia]|uniref:protein-serine/threonine phosphatase n=1 Tax=Vanilla planifolia TaxID=51239 RepID=A0A835QG08_VANPL|nr:hypothetical protein HPP92_016876 [Vanilla planifolia]